jgi:peptidoglycan/LPS O-acetylase OafA/YrhL
MGITARPGRSHIPTLDGVRGVAILLVLIAHVPLKEQAHPAVRQLMHMLGYLGVDLFFVLSGFLITRILRADREENVPVRAFYARRALRIFPIYYLVLSVHAMVAPSPVLPWCAAYLSNYYLALHPTETLLGHTWSLAVEEHFYLVWPFIVHRLTAKTAWRALIVLMGLSLASSALLIVVQSPYAAALIYNGSLSRMWSLGLGALVAYRWSPVDPRWPTSVRALPLAIGLAFVGIGVVLAKNGSTWAFPLHVMGFSSISVAGILAALHYAGPLPSSAHSWRALHPKAVLTAKPLTFLGKVSYGLYLYHPFVYAAIFGGSFVAAQRLPVAAQIIAATTGAVALAALSYYALERHILKFKGRLSQPKIQMATPP